MSSSDKNAIFIKTCLESFYCNSARLFFNFIICTQAILTFRKQSITKWDMNYSNHEFLSIDQICLPHTEKKDIMNKIFWVATFSVMKSLFKWMPWYFLCINGYVIFSVGVSSLNHRIKVEWLFHVFCVLLIVYFMCSNTLWIRIFHLIGYRNQILIWS